MESMLIGENLFLKWIIKSKYKFGEIPSMFKYQTSHINPMINEPNPFVQPLQVYSNIHSALGIFAEYQMQRIKIY